MPLPTTAPSRDQLIEHLVATRIAGDVATPREGNLANIRKMLDRHPEYTFGLTPDRTWTYDEVLAVMADRCGISPDAGHTVGSDTIDPELTLDGLDRMRERLAKAAKDRQRVVVATGHPAGVLAIHLPVAAALAGAGCPLLTPAEGWAMRLPTGEHREVRYVGNVAMVSNRGNLNHTHLAAPIEAVLRTLADAGEAPPDLVVADHGWAGGAAQAGVDAVGFADSNDPALFVGEVEGKVAVTVPLDDNVLPLHYAPVAAYLTSALR